MFHKERSSANNSFRTPANPQNPFASSISNAFSSTPSFPSFSLSNTSNTRSAGTQETSIPSEAFSVNSKSSNPFARKETSTVAANKSPFIFPQKTNGQETAKDDMKCASFAFGSTNLSHSSYSNPFASFSSPVMAPSSIVIPNSSSSIFERSQRKLVKSGFKTLFGDKPAKMEPRKLEKRTFDQKKEMKGNHAEHILKKQLLKRESKYRVKPRPGKEISSLKCMESLASENVREENDIEAVAETLQEDQTKFALISAVNLDGLCIDKCSAMERELHLRVDELSVFERSEPMNPKTPQELIVKRFQRSSANHKLNIAEEVRPPGVLRRTQLYLEREIMDRDKRGIDMRFDPPRIPERIELYNFCWDRTRMIRKDFVLQNYRGAGGRVHPIVLDVHERIARYHIMSEHELCEVTSFVAQQNMEQLGQTLKSLNELYDEALKTGDIRYQSPFEPEFRAYFILCTLDNGRGMDVLKFVKGLRGSLMTTAPLQFAMKVFIARHTSDYHQFFRLFRESTYLQSCLLFRYIPSMRSCALQCMNRAYRHYPYPLKHMVDLLCFDSLDHALEICREHNLDVTHKKDNDLDVEPSNEAVDDAVIRFGGEFESDVQLRMKKTPLQIRASKRYIEDKQRDYLRSDVCRGVTEYADHEYPRLSQLLHEAEVMEHQKLYPNSPSYEDTYSKFADYTLSPPQTLQSSPSEEIAQAPTSTISKETEIKAENDWNSIESRKLKLENERRLAIERIEELRKEKELAEARKRVQEWKDAQKVVIEPIAPSKTVQIETPSDTQEEEEEARQQHERAAQLLAQANAQAQAHAKALEQEQLRLKHQQALQEQQRLEEIKAEKRLKAQRLHSQRMARQRRKKRHAILFFRFDQWKRHRNLSKMQTLPSPDLKAIIISSSRNTCATDSSTSTAIPTESCVIPTVTSTCTIPSMASTVSPANIPIRAPHQPRITPVPLPPSLCAETFMRLLSQQLLHQHPGLREINYKLVVCDVQRPISAFAKRIAHCFAVSDESRIKFQQTTTNTKRRVILCTQYVNDRSDALQGTDLLVMPIDFDAYVVTKNLLACFRANSTPILILSFACTAFAQNEKRMERWKDRCRAWSAEYSHVSSAFLTFDCTAQEMYGHVLAQVRPSARQGAFVSVSLSSLISRFLVSVSCSCHRVKQLPTLCRQLWNAYRHEVLVTDTAPEIVVLVYDGVEKRSTQSAIDAFFCPLACTERMEDAKTYIQNLFYGVEGTQVDALVKMAEETDWEGLLRKAFHVYLELKGPVYAYVSEACMRRMEEILQRNLYFVKNQECEHDLEKVKKVLKEKRKGSHEVYGKQVKRVMQEIALQGLVTRKYQRFLSRELARGKELTMIG